MKSYLISALEATLSQDFPSRAETLKAAFYTRLDQLRAENAGASREKQRHLENQILPGIAAYETLQSVMPKEAALQTVHGYVEKKAWRLKAAFLNLMRLPGFYRKVPGIFARQTPELCHCFCDSDDITYDGLHPKLVWHRTRTLGRGGDCCDFCLKIAGK